MLPSNHGRFEKNRAEIPEIPIYYMGFQIVRSFYLAERLPSESAHHQILGLQHKVTCKAR